MQFRYAVVTLTWTYQHSRARGENELNETDDNSRIMFIYCASSWLENADSVIHDSVDTAELLKEHQTHGDTKGFQNGTLQQLFELDLLFIIIFGVLFDIVSHPLKFICNIGPP